jgi:hypothetical protein
VVTDPSTSNLVRRGNNTGTLRIYGQDDNSQWHVFGDYRGKDVVVGFGASGGFWTGINGLFTFVFGTSLLCAVTGVYFQTHIVTCSKMDGRDEPLVNLWFSA